MRWFHRVFLLFIFLLNDRCLNYNFSRFYDVHRLDLATMTAKTAMAMITTTIIINIIIIIVLKSLPKSSWDGQSASCE